MRKIFILILIVTTFSCRDNSANNLSNNPQDNKMRMLNIEQLGANGRTSFAHYLYMPDKTIADSVLIKHGQNYIDSLKTSKPVSLLFFVSSDEGFTISPEDNDLDEIRKNTFAKLNYSNTSGPEQGKFEKITRYNRK